MTGDTQDQALWLVAKRGALRIGPAPAAAPRLNEIVVANRAVAVNPVDRLLSPIGAFIAPWLEYPAVPGSDVAGVVTAVGGAVTRFRVGDRVVGHAAGLEKGHRAAEGAFRRLTVLAEHMAAPIPPGMAFTDAVVLPLGLSTAASGLFGTDGLALRPPGAADAPPSGSTVLVWGGSTSVGCNAVQLAVAAGYDVVATASPRNFALLRELGARAVFDYRDPGVVRALTGALRGCRLAGALAIGTGSARPCIAVAGASEGRRTVAMVSPEVSFDGAPAGGNRLRWLLPVLARLAAGTLRRRVLARRLGVRTRMVWGGAPVGNAVGPMIWADYLPRALAEGRHVPAPAPLLAGHGLAAIPAALDRLRDGVSARKVVVTL